VLEVGSDPEVLIFRNSTSLDPQVGSTRGLGVRQKGFDAIMVVVDRFSKMAHFIPTKDEATAQETGRLFFSHIFKHHGLPKDIVSDRDPKFTSKF